MAVCAFVQSRLLFSFSRQPAPPPPPPTARAPLQLLSQDKSSFIVHDKLSSLSLNQK